MKKLASIAVISAMLAAAPAQADGPQELLGTILGGAAGGYAGSHIGSGSGRLAATAGGAVLGAWLGNGVGTSLDRADSVYGGYRTRAYPPPPMAYAPPPAPVYVERHSYYYRPAPVYERPRHARWRHRQPPPAAYQPVQQHCREYQSQVAVGGYAQPGYGTACLQPDGSWQIVR